MATAQLASPAPIMDVSSSESKAPPRIYLSLGFWTITVVAIGVTWRTARLLLQFPIWGDESFVCVNFLDNTYMGLLGPLRVGQICPLTFLWSELAIYEWLGASELVMRLLPFLAGLGALALFWPLCRRVLPYWPASLAMGLLAVSYYPVRHAVEVKPYAEDLLVTLALLLPACCYIMNPARSRGMVLLALFVPLALVSSYPAVLVAGSISLALCPIVWRQGRSQWGWFALYNVLLLATFVANYLIVGKPQLSPHIGNPNNAFNSTWHEWFPDLDGINLFWWFLKAHSGNMLAYPIGGPNFASSLTTLLCLLGAWSWWRHGNRQTLALLLWPFALSMLAAVLHKYPYGGSARLDQHLAPAICLLAGNGIAILLVVVSRGGEGEKGRGGEKLNFLLSPSPFLPLSPSPRLLVSLSPLILLSAFGLAGLARDIIKPFKTTAELWNRTFVQDLMTRVGPEDRVVFFHAPSEVRPGLEWYLRQHDDRVRWHGQIDWDRFEAGTGKLWCVRIDFNTARPDIILAAFAHAGRSPITVEHFQSTAPPEHGDDPEIAEVFCFVRQ